MKFKSPSLAELHAFLGVCQLGSFRRAADVLSVTQGAVSQAILRLEQRLGCSLFDRQATGVVPTARGREFQKLVETHVAALESAVTQFGGAASQRKVRVSVVPTLGTRWLVPRLARFQSLNPNIEVELRQFRFDEDFKRDDVDLWIALRRPGRRWPRGIQGRYLLGNEITPACTPALARNIQHPEDFAAHTLLHHINYPDNWALWMEGSGVKQPVPALGPGFDLGNNLIVAAAAGMGAIVIQPCLIEGELDSGKLVLPFETRVATGRGYYLCQRSATAHKNRAAEVFASWLQAQAGDAVIA
jgi:DNA-binding transcriptional LysR family regulator